MLFSFPFVRKRQSHMHFTMMQAPYKHLRKPTQKSTTRIHVLQGLAISQQDAHTHKLTHTNTSTHTHTHREVGAGVLKSHHAPVCCAEVGGLKALPFLAALPV